MQEDTLACELENEFTNVEISGVGVDLVEQLIVKCCRVRVFVIVDDLRERRQENDCQSEVLKLC
jgi:hypothetical protein